MWLNGGEVTAKAVVVMQPNHNADARECPVCGTRLPRGAQHRRCPRCGAKKLWSQQPEQPPVDYGTVLFNTRLCGIMGGLQIGMIALLLTGYRLPLPWGVAVIMLATPFVGYYLGGLTARCVPRSWRVGLLVAALALNAGLVVALIAAVMVTPDPVVLAAIAVGVAFALKPLIHRAVAQGSTDEE